MDFKCDSNCQMFSPHKICSHVVAVAEMHGKTENLLSITHRDKRIQISLHWSWLAHHLPGSQGTKRKRTRAKKASDSSFVKKVDRIELFLPRYITSFFILDIQLTKLTVSHYRLQFSSSSTSFIWSQSWHVV